MDFDSLGSTTFRRHLLDKGLEPDDCYYIQNYNKVWDKENLDLEVDPPPDLVVEVEVSVRMIRRLPIYAALGVPEVWRHNGLRLMGLGLVNGRYEAIDASRAFPFLKVDDLNRFLDRALLIRKNILLAEFCEWVRKGMG